MNDEFDPRTAITEIHAILKQPNEFAKIFCHAAKIDKTIDIVLKDTVRELIKTDQNTRELLKLILKEVQNDDWKIFARKIGFGLWTLISVIFGGIGVTFLRLFK
jgi:hypothetical protein